MVRVGIIGCGEMGRHFVEPFIACRDICRVTAAVDADRSRAEAWALRHGGEITVETDYRRVMDRVDTVFCSLPHDLHEPVGIACLEAGKHVLMEKPLAITEAGCRSMIEAARRAGRVLMVAMPIAYHPLVTGMREILARREYGEIIQVSIWTEQKTVCEGGWRAGSESRGGGQLFCHGCHYVDILLRLLGRPVEGMHLGSSHGTPWMGGDEGTSNLLVRFEDGPLGYHFATWGAGGTKLGYAIHAHCTEGMLEADIWEGRLRAYIGGPHISPAGEIKTLLRCAGGFNLFAEIRHFIQCVETGARPETDGARALQSLRVIWRLYEAEKEGRLADLRGLGLEDA